MKSVYVIATYGGHRPTARMSPFGNAEYLNSPSWNIKTHLERLSKLKHNINQIIVVVPPNPKKFLSELSVIADQYSIEVFYRRKNQGMSYGGYSDVFGYYKNKFDYYFFFEDDYVPVLDNFDSIFIENYSGGWLHTGGVECGLVSSKVLQKVWDRFKCLPSANNDSSSQLAFANGFFQVNEPRVDLLGKVDLSAGYYYHYGVLWMYGKQDSPAIVMPLQSLYKELPIQWK